MVLSKMFASVLNPSAIQTWATFLAGVAALAAAIAVFFQLRFARFSMGVNLLVKLEGDFESPDFRKRRQAAAQAIGTRDLSDVEDVLDFFETVGLLTRRRALDPHFLFEAGGSNLMMSPTPIFMRC